MSRQLEFDWATAAIATLRKLLTRADKALKGRSIDSSSGHPKDRVGGKTLAAILNGVFAWSLSTDPTTGRTVVTTTRWRPVQELAPELDLRTIRKGLAVLRSAEACECIAAKEGRVEQSPAVDLWIVWSRLDAWVQLLEAVPAPKRSKRVTVEAEVTVPQEADLTVPQDAFHGAAGCFSRCRSVTVHGAAAAPSMVPQRHRPLYDGVRRIGTSLEITSSPLNDATSPGREEEEGFEAFQQGVETEPSKRRELIELLRQRLDVDLAEELADEAGKFAGLDHAIAVARHAIEREIVLPGNAGVLRPWGPGAVFRRLSKPGLVSLPVTRGWATACSDWKAEWDRQAGKRKRDAEAARASLRASIERLRPADLESQFSVLVERLSPQEQFELLPIEWRFEVKSREDLAVPMVRAALLRAAALRELSQRGVHVS